MSDLHTALPALRGAERDTDSGPNLSHHQTLGQRKVVDTGGGHTLLDGVAGQRAAYRFSLPTTHYQELVLL